MSQSELPALLESSSERLNGLFNERERTFLSIGRHLGDAITEICKITGAFEALPGLLDSESLQKATNCIASVVQMTEAIRQAVGIENAALNELHALNREIGECLECLQHSIRTIGILTSNAKIEAARVDGAGNDFSNFTAEIAHLAKRAQETVGGYLDEHRKLVILLHNVGKTQAQFQHKYQDTLVSISADLDTTLKSVEARRHQAAASAVDIAERSKRINMAIGTAVMSLQVSDISRQRIEHIHSALELLETGYERAAESEEGTWAAALDEPERDEITAVISGLQSEQLEDTIAEYDETVQKIHDSLEQLVDECHSIANEGSHIYGATGQDAESFLGALKSKLGDGMSLIRDCQIARSAVTDASAVVATTVRELQEKINTVNHIVLDMTIVGMNAALKSRQLGGLGRGLGIIADELRNYANQTAKDADSLAPALSRVIESAERFETMRVSQGDDTPDLDAELAVALQGFDLSAEKLNEALNVLSHGARRVGKVLQDSVAQIDGQRAAPIALHQALIELDQLASSADAPSRPDVLSELLEQIARSYTMATERNVHQRFAAKHVGVTSAKLPNAHTSPPASEPDEEILDDVLFG